MSELNPMERLALTEEIDDLESEFCLSQLRGEGPVARPEREQVFSSFVAGLQSDIALLKHDSSCLAEWLRNRLTTFRKRWLRFSFGALSMLALFSSLNSCATVKPYERENLADRIMDFDAKQEEDAMELHFLNTREASIGGYGGAGGGCACN
jgi:hypothetical protein